MSKTKIESSSSSAMTVRELIDELKGMPQDAKVHFAYDYGDRSHKQVARGVEEVAVEGLYWSDYLASPAVCESSKDHDALVDAVILR